MIGHSSVEYWSCLYAGESGNFFSWALATVLSALALVMTKPAKAAQFLSTKADLHLWPHLAEFPRQAAAHINTHQKVHNFQLEPFDAGSHSIHQQVLHLRLLVCFRISVTQASRVKNRNLGAIHLKNVDGGALRVRGQLGFCLHASSKDVDQRSLACACSTTNHVDILAHDLVPRRARK